MRAEIVNRKNISSPTTIYKAAGTCLQYIIAFSPESKGLFNLYEGFYKTLVISCMLQFTSQKKEYLDFYCIYWFQWESKQYQHVSCMLDLDILDYTVMYNAVPCTVFLTECVSSERRGRGSQRPYQKLHTLLRPG